MIDGTAIYIIGHSASGKTELSLRLAKNLNAEIVNCDAFYFYKNCDILTANVTQEEQEQVPHHCIKFLEPNQTNFDVRQFRELAL